MRSISSRRTLAQKLTARTKSFVQANTAMTVKPDDIEIILNETFTIGNTAGTLKHSAMQNTVLQESFVFTDAENKT